MNVAITAVAIGGWYPRGIARMIQEFDRVSPGLRLQAHINTVPLGTPTVVEDGWDYTGYCAKPFAVLDAFQRGADIVILLDAAFFPIRPIHPLIDHIARTGYYFCRNGAVVGNWSSDRCLSLMGMDRDEAMSVEEISTYCVGLNRADGRSMDLLHRWCGFAGDRLTFPGHHTHGETGRNPGFCSLDARCRGHRHDQTVLSILAHRLGMHELVSRPRFTAYLHSETEETVLVNQGMG